MFFLPHISFGNTQEISLKYFANTVPKIICKLEYCKVSIKLLTQNFLENSLETLWP